MRKNDFKSDIRLVGMKNHEGNRRMIDYYLMDHHGDRTLIYKGHYGNDIYNLCKGGIQINRLLAQKSRNTCVMKLIDHVYEVLPDYLGSDAFVPAV